MFGNQMLTSTTEEKEKSRHGDDSNDNQRQDVNNRKDIIINYLGFCANRVYNYSNLIVYVLFHDRLALPNFDLNNIPIDPVRVSIAAVIFAFSFLLFTGLLVAIGAIAPTAKEAGSFFEL